MVTKAVDDLLELMFSVKKGCPGVDLEMHIQANVNDALAEGQSEYFAIQALGKAAKDQRPERLFPEGLSSVDLWNANLKKLHAERLKEGSKLDIKDGNSNREQGWTAHEEGNQIMEYIMVGVKEKGIPAFKASTSFTEFNQIWLDAGNHGFSDAWEKAFGLKWSAFVCKLENSIVGNDKCKASSSWDHSWRSPCTEGQHFKEAYPYSLCKPATGSKNVTMISAQSVFKYEDEMDDEDEIEDEDDDYMTAAV